MQFQNAFDARQVEPSSFSLIPAGDYPARIIASEPLATNAGDGGMLKLTLEILDGPAKGKHLFWNLNLFNKSAQAVEIAYKQLSAICHVTGVYNITHSEQLHNVPFIAVVNNDGQYNNVKGVKDVYGNAPGKSTQAPPAAPAPAAPVPAPAPAWAPPAATAPPAQPTAPAAPPWAQPAQPAAAPTWAPPGAPAAAAPAATPSAPAVPPWAQPR